VPDSSTELEPRQATADATPSVGSQLCTQCGLCCTGALHSFAVLDPDELEFAAGLGLKLRTDGRPGFALPCQYLNSCACTIYTSRPRVCARYQCQLLDDVQQSKVALDDALEHVRVAKQMFEQVRALLPPGMTLPEARALAAKPADAASPACDNEMQLRLAVITLSLYLDRHFRHSSEGKMLTMTAVADDMEEARQE
jgi:hypothetical protein